MGFWGHLLLARSSRSLRDLRDVRAFGEAEQERELGDGWRVLALGNKPTDLRQALAPVVRATATAALVAYFLDSDCAVIEAQTPSGLRWTGVLNRATAEGSYEGVADDVEPTDRAMIGATRWAKEAGLTPHADVLRGALSNNAVFAEDLFDDLLRGLGVPGAGPRAT